MIVIWTYAVRTGSFENRTAETRVRTRIKVDFAVQTCQYSVLITAQSKSSFHSVPLRMHSQRFTPAELHFDRPLIFHSGQSGQVLSSNILLAAKASAYELILNNDSFRSIFPAEHDQCFVASIVSALIRRKDLDSIPVRE